MMPLKGPVLQQQQQQQKKKKQKEQQQQQQYQPFILFDAAAATSESAAALLLYPHLRGAPCWGPPQLRVLLHVTQGRLSWGPSTRVLELLYD